MFRGGAAPSRDTFAQWLAAAPPNYPQRGFIITTLTHWCKTPARGLKWAPAFESDRDMEEWTKYLSKQKRKHDKRKLASASGCFSVYDGDNRWDVEWRMVSSQKLRRRPSKSKQEQYFGAYSYDRMFQGGAKDEDMETGGTERVNDNNERVNSRGSAAGQAAEH